MKHPHNAHLPRNGGFERYALFSTVRSYDTFLEPPSSRECFRLHDPARAAIRRGYRFRYFLKTPSDQFQESFYVQARVEELDHLFEAESSLLASDGQLTDCPQ